MSVFYFNPLNSHKYQPQQHTSPVSQNLLSKIVNNFIYSLGFSQVFGKNGNALAKDA